ncbi:MAG: redoxin family protein [Desulfobulbaceae bacterium]|nr:MAG: redoxin family protein [Desulfobulbaceae bacterium]
MSTRFFTPAAACLAALLLVACGAKQAPIVIDSQSSVPGTQVTRKGEVLALTGTGIRVGHKLPATNLIDAMTMQPVNLADNQGSVLFLSIVPSIDTKVCEEQTHLLAEQGDRLPDAVRRITVSRDTPFAQARFAEEARLEDIEYLSDYKEGEFGRSVGLLIESSRLLARAVILVDGHGVVRYIQVVPDTTHLPDMEKAFAEAEKLVKQVK